MVLRPVEQKPDRVPASATKDCAGPLAKSAVDTGVIIERMQWAEYHLVECGAQIRTVREWDAGRVTP